MQRGTIFVGGLVIAAVIAGIFVGASALRPSAPGETSGAGATPSPTGSPRVRTHGYVVAEGKAPLRVQANYPLIEGTILTRVGSRIDGLRATQTPDGYVNPYAGSKARLARVTNDEPNVITLWFNIANDDWGVGPDQAKLLLQQLVWTVTEESGIELVRIMQNEGRKGGASIAGVSANYEMTRKTFP